MLDEARNPTSAAAARRPGKLGDTDLAFLDSYADELGSLAARGTITWQHDPIRAGGITSRPLGTLKAKSGLLDGLDSLSETGPTAAFRNIATGAGHTIDVGTAESDRRNRGIEISRQAEAEFELQYIVGHGGQGQVWSAWQHRLLREVAVKRLTTGQTSDFLQEAYTSAELDHPNIIPIYDLVYDPNRPDSKPLLAMKMVRGESWDRLLRTERMAAGFALEASLSRHLRTFIDVCNAVAYAHSKGIIHRDLKPSQVMVGAYGEVYLMDWGLALLLLDHAPVAELVGGPKVPLVRDAIGCAGSPAYMAPEQTKKSPDGLGIHTDIYLLGSILFELVAGEPPHMAPRATEALVAAMRNEMRPMPSACPAELRAIVERALAQDPLDRHASAEELRDEIEDYLSGAGQMRESMRLAEIVAKRLDRLAVEPLTYADFGQIEQNLGRAIALWPRNVEAHRSLEQVRLGHARRALSEGDLVLAQTVAKALPEHLEGRSELQRGIAERLQLQLRQTRQRRLAVAASMLLFAGILITVAISFVRQRQTNRELQSALDSADVATQRLEIKLGQLNKEREGAYDLMNYVLTDMQERLSRIGELDLLDQITSRTLTYYRTLPANDNDDDGMRLRGILFQHVADIYLKQGDPANALEVYQQALTIARQIVVLHPDDVDGLGQLAVVRHRIGQVEGQLGRWEQAADTLDDASAQLRRLARAHPEEPRWASELAAVEASMGALEQGRGRLNEALAHQASALQHRRELAASQQESDASRVALAESLLAVGTLQARLDHPGEAADAYDEALLLLRNVANDDPGNGLAQATLAEALGRSAHLRHRRGEFESALRDVRSGLAIRQRLARIDPHRADWQTQLALDQALAVRLMLETGDAAGALTAIDATERGLAVSLAADEPARAIREVQAAITRDEGLANEILGDPKAAQDLLKRSVQLYTALFGAPAPSEIDRTPLYDASYHLARVQAATGNVFGALGALDWAIRDAEATVRQARGDIVPAKAREALGQLLYPLAVRLHLANNEAEAAFRRLELAIDNGFRDQQALREMPGLELLRQQDAKRLDASIERMAAE